jgi:threonine/homoserine/homoserine lactone efflux protein
VGSWRSWRKGLLTHLLNPKAGASYVAMLPQFGPAGASPLAMGVLLASMHNAEAMVWFTAIILGAHGIRGWLSRPSVQRTVDQLTGTALLAFGLRLGLSAR